MATQMNINLKTSKLNQPNRFTLTFNHRTLFDLYLTDDETEELSSLVMKCAGRIFEEHLK